MFALRSFRGGGRRHTAPVLFDGRRCWENAEATDWDRLQRAVDDAKTRASVVIVEGYTICDGPSELVGSANAVYLIESTIEQCIARRTSFPTRDKYGEEGWPDAEAYVRSCVWPSYESYASRVRDHAKLLEPLGTIDARVSQIASDLTRKRAHASG